MLSHLRKSEFSLWSSSLTFWLIFTAGTLLHLSFGLTVTSSPLNVTDFSLGALFHFISLSHFIAQYPRYLRSGCPCGVAWCQVHRSELLGRFLSSFMFFMLRNYVAHFSLSVIPSSSWHQQSRDCIPSCPPNPTSALLFFHESPQLPGYQDHYVCCFSLPGIPASRYRARFLLHFLYVFSQVSPP